MSRNSIVISKEIVEDIAFSLKFDLIEENDLVYVINLSENINNGIIKIYNQPETIKFFRMKVEDYCKKNCDKLSNKIKDENQKEKFINLFRERKPEKPQLDNQYIPKKESENKNELPSNKSKTDNQNIPKKEPENKNEPPSNKSKTDSQNTPKTKTSSGKKDSFKTRRPNENKKPTFNNIQQSSQKKYLKTITLSSISFIIIISSILLLHFYNPLKSKIKLGDSLEQPDISNNKQKANIHLAQLQKEKKMTDGINTVNNKIPGEENDMTDEKDKTNHWIDKMKTKMKDGMNTVKIMSKHLINKVKNKIPGEENKMTDGKNKINHWKNKVKSKMTNGINTVKSMSKNLINKVKNKIKKD